MKTLSTTHSSPFDLEVQVESIKHILAHPAEGEMRAIFATEPNGDLHGSGISDTSNVRRLLTNQIIRMHRRQLYLEAKALIHTIKRGMLGLRTMEVRGIMKIMREIRMMEMMKRMVQRMMKVLKRKMKMMKRLLRVMKRLMKMIKMMKRIMKMVTKGMMKMVKRRIKMMKRMIGGRKWMKRMI